MAPATCTCPFVQRLARTRLFRAVSLVVYLSLSAALFLALSAVYVRSCLRKQLIVRVVSKASGRIECVRETHDASLRSDTCMFIRMWYGVVSLWHIVECCTNSVDNYSTFHSMFR